MKRFFIAILLILTVGFIFTSCSSDEEDFAYPMEQLYGKWEATDVQVNGTWYDITKYPYTKFRMSISFKNDGTFYGNGYLGNGSGTYKTNDKTIITYVDEQEYAVYTVSSLTQNKADFTLRMGNESIRMKAEKKYDSGQVDNNDLMYKTFYESRGDGYFVIDFISNDKFIFYEADKNFIQKNPEWTGIYEYDSSTGNIDFKNSIVLVWYSLLFESRKFLSGKYDGRRLKVDYVYSIGENWSSEYTMTFYPQNNSSLK